MSNDVITQLWQHAERTPNRIALRWRTRALNYAELTAAVEHTAQFLLAQGLTPGQHLVIWANKRIETVVVILAAWVAGLVIVPLHPALRAGQLRSIFSRAAAQGIVTDAPHAQALGFAELSPTGWGYRSTPDAPFKLLPFDVPAADRPVRPRHALPLPYLGDTLAALMFTSGSTGLPKGVMVTHDNVNAGAAAVSQYLGLTTTDELLAVLPLSFDYGLSQITTALLAGAGITLQDYLLPNDLKNPLTHGGITVLAGTPGLLIPLSQATWLGDAPALRLITNSGGKLPTACVKALRAARPHMALYLMYGLTEAFRASFLDPAEVDAYPDSMGRPFSASVLGLVDDQGVLIPEGAEGAGELVQGGPLVTQGYFNDPAATAERYRSPPAGWPNGNDRVVVFSGDQVRRDQAGRYYFLGRLDEQIKVQGFRVSPEEIEHAALLHPGVTEALAFGYTPDRDRHNAQDESATASAIGLVVAPASVNVPELKNWLQTQLAPYQMPTHLIALPAVPRSNNGKLDRAASRDQLLDQLKQSLQAQP
jgi:acyl-CoA synthetase (AMP-forming)/AMP-acid ligase II